VRFAVLALVCACGRWDFDIISRATDGGGDGRIADGNGDAPHDSAVAACDVATPFNAPVALSALNSTADDWSARLNHDELTVYFASARPGALGGASIYSATRPGIGDAFGTPSLVANVNSASSTRVHPSLSPNQLALYMQDSPSPGAGDIVAATRTGTGAAFGSPTAVSGVNSTSDDLMPFVAADGTQLLLSSNRSGNYRIYTAPESAGTYTNPTELSSIAPVSGDDEAPVLSSDGLTLYFSSSRTDTAFDIYVSTRATTSDAFGAPTLVSELSVAGAYDAPSWLSADNCRLYMMSNRTVGNIDLYLATR
jgi:hypothetical protein